MKKNEFKIFSFYQFIKILKPLKLKNLLKDFCQFHKLKGTILVAKEGINGTIGGTEQSIRDFEKKILQLGFKSLISKYSFNPYMPFYRLKIKYKNEIITFTKKQLDIQNVRAKSIEPKDWNKIINNKDVYLIDVRNNYESEIGTFKKAIKSNTKNFTEFKNYIKNNLIDKKNKKIAMFCTGGIRCEKASSYMMSLGFKNLYQLKGGILDYLKDISKKESKWEGECFLFDNRVSVKNEMQKGSYSLCHGCRMPLLKKDKLSSKFENGVSCDKCFDQTSEIKKDRLRQRNRQIEIAKKKGLYNPFIRYTPSDY